MQSIWPAASISVSSSGFHRKSKACSDPDIVHKTITLNGLDVAVVGIAPEGFDGTELARAAFFGPLSLQPAIYPEQNYINDPQVSWPTLLARRHADSAIDQVRAELTVVALGEWQARCWRGGPSGHFSRRCSRLCRGCPNPDLMPIRI